VKLDLTNANSLRKYRINKCKLDLKIGVFNNGIGLPQFGFQHSNTTNRIRIITKGCLDKSNVVSSI
jgi:hypothetical protein